MTVYKQHSYNRTHGGTKCLQTTGDETNVFDGKFRAEADTFTIGQVSKSFRYLHLGISADSTGLPHPKISEEGKRTLSDSKFKIIAFLTM